MNTENKRFMIDNCGELIDLNNHTFVEYGDEVCNLLNELHEEIQYWKELLGDYLDIQDENEQLKQRNDRQAKRLGELYELMAKKDWESLTEIIDDFCSCEKQLQRESRTYSDWND